jgi:hypothetical protein
MQLSDEIRDRTVIIIDIDTDSCDYSTTFANQCPRLPSVVIADCVASIRWPRSSSDGTGIDVAPHCMGDDGRINQVQDSGCGNPGACRSTLNQADKSGAL